MILGIREHEERELVKVKESKWNLHIVHMPLRFLADLADVARQFIRLNHSAPLRLKCCIRCGPYYESKKCFCRLISPNEQASKMVESLGDRLIQ